MTGVRRQGNVPHERGEADRAGSREVCCAQAGVCSQETLDDLKVPHGNRLHALKADRKGQYAIAGNDQWRICFRLHRGDAYDVEFCDYHSRRRHAMSIPNTRALQRRPTHPGEMLREDFLPNYELTVSGLAAAVGVSRQSINELLRCRRAVSPEMALRLAKVFGNSAEFWRNAQRAVDLWEAAQLLKSAVARIMPLRAA